jgi:branched-chain amino acid transport system ATP-binding protein
MLTLIDVHTYYSDSYVLQGISLELKEGSAVTLLGRNGMGKTTTIRSIIGFTPPRSGSIIFEEKNVIGLKPHKIAQMGIGLVPQGRRIFPSLSVKENLTMSARDISDLEAWSLDKIYALFPLLEKRASHRGTVLSGGEQAMLSIGRALMTNPKLLLMDEPSEGLAPMLVQELGRIMTRLKIKGISILLVEQNFPMALGVADYVYIISKGTIVYKSRPDALKNDEEVKARYLGVTT